MRFFFRNKVPAATNVLIIESVPPEVTGRAMAGLRKLFPKARFHLLTCFPVPSSHHYSSVYEVDKYPGWKAKLALLFRLRKKRWGIMAILCTGQRILLSWKICALLLIPSKTLIVNENADFFWLHWKNWKILLQLSASRLGLNIQIRKPLVTFFRSLFFPFTLLFLLLTALFLYSRHWYRMALWRVSPPPDRLTAASESHPSPGSSTMTNTPRPSEEQSPVLHDTQKP